jgi:hypothetical protein
MSRVEGGKEKAADPTVRSILIGLGLALMKVEKRKEALLPANPSRVEYVLTQIIIKKTVLRNEVRTPDRIKLISNATVSSDLKHKRPVEIRLLLIQISPEKRGS